MVSPHRFDKITNPSVALKSTRDPRCSGELPATLNQPSLPMLSWTITFLIIAVIAGLLGFTGVAGTAAGIAKILFFVFLVLLVVSLLAGAVRGKR